MRFLCMVCYEQKTLDRLEPRRDSSLRRIIAQTLTAIAVRWLGSIHRSLTRIFPFWRHPPWLFLRRIVLFRLEKRARRKPMAVSVEASQSITRLIRAAQDGSSSAVRPLLSAYFDRLVRLARKRLRNLPAWAATMRIWRCTHSTACTDGFATRRGRWSWPTAMTFGGCWPPGQSRGPSI